MPRHRSDILRISDAGEQEMRYHGAITSTPIKLNMGLRQARVEELLCFKDLYQARQAHGAKPPYIVAFVNSRSGNTKVSEAIRCQLKTLLEDPFMDTAGREIDLRGEICELSDGMPRDTIKEVKKKPEVRGREIRFLVCGGDGTVTWLLQEIEASKRECPALFADDKEPPIGIVPAGTGNDLARSLGWGPKLRRVRDLVGYVQWMLEGCPVALDQWRVTLRLTSEGSDHVELPPAFHMVEGESCVYEGYFQNYFSVGMDAAATYGVERARKCWLGRYIFRWGLGKLCYAAQAYRTGACQPCCAKTLSLSDLTVTELENNVPRTRSEEGGPARQLTLLNINSYGSGRVPFSSDDLPLVRPADGQLELFTMRHALQFGTMMGGCASAVLTARPERVTFRLGRGEYFQMDGESWWCNGACEVTVEPHRKVLMLRPPTCPPGIWHGRQVAGFWGPARGTL